jgi:hypothetical protein
LDVGSIPTALVEEKYMTGLLIKRSRPMSEEHDRKAKNDRIQAIFLTVSRDKRAIYGKAFGETMDRLQEGKATEEEIARAAGEAAITMHDLIIEQVPRANVTVEDCVHCLYDAIKVRIAKS